MLVFTPGAIKMQLLRTQNSLRNVTLFFSPNSSKTVSKWGHKRYPKTSQIEPWRPHGSPRASLGRFWQPHAPFGVVLPLIWDRVGHHFCVRERHIAQLASLSTSQDLGINATQHVEIQATPHSIPNQRGLAAGGEALR